MSYREYRPPTDLAADFRCGWINQAEDRTDPFLVLPDGCIDLVWSDGRLRIAGPDRRAAVTRAGPIVVGLRFQAGMAADWLGVPASDILDARPGLDAFWGHEAQALADWAGEAPDAQGVLARLQAGLRARQPRIRRRATAATAVFDRIDRGEALDWSPRTLRRRCHDWFGYGPKTLDAILRLQRFIALCRTGGENRLAMAAIGAGYADQPHLNRETRRLCGLTPRRLLAQLDT